MNPFCSVIVLNYNGRRFLSGCLDSLLAQSYSPFETIFVDNASSDGSAAFVRETYPSVRVLEAERNLGFAGGNNFGYRHASGEIIVLLNNDTVVEPGWLEQLVAALAPADVAAASSLILTEGVPPEYYERNGTINFLGHNIMRKFERPEEIFFAGGASLAYKREILGEPFDADYFAYSEDVHLSLRARFMGYEIRHAAASRVKHFGGGTSGKRPSRYLLYLQERNRLLNMLLFFSGSTLARIFPLLMLNLPAKLAASLFTRRYSFFSILRAYCWLIFHPRLIARKRERLRAVKCVPDSAVTEKMSADLTFGNTLPQRIVDGIGRASCRTFGVHTLENR